MYTASIHCICSFPVWFQSKIIMVTLSNISYKFLSIDRSSLSVSCVLKLLLFDNPSCDANARRRPFTKLNSQLEATTVARSRPDRLRKWHNSTSMNRIERVSVLGSGRWLKLTQLIATLIQRRFTSGFPSLSEQPFAWWNPTGGHRVEGRPRKRMCIYIFESILHTTKSW